MAARKKARDPDIRTTFGKLSDDTLLDDGQLALLADVSIPTIKRWRRKEKTPPVIRLNGLPRTRVGAIRPWLLQEKTVETTK